MWLKTSSKGMVGKGTETSHQLKQIGLVFFRAHVVLPFWFDA